MARLMGSCHTKAPNPSLVTPGEGEDKTYLLFTTGSLTYSPHQIGVCIFIIIMFLNCVHKEEEVLGVDASAILCLCVFQVLNGSCLIR